MFGKPQKEPRKTVEGSEIQMGTAIVDYKGDYVGRVIEVVEKGFLIDRSSVHKPVLFVPFDECIHDGEKQLKLETPIEEIDQRGWDGSGYSK